MPAPRRAAQDRPVTSTPLHSPSTPGTDARHSDPPTEADRRAATAVVRLERALAARPGFGRTTDVATTVLGDGLGCSTSVGPHTVESDLPDALGGDGGAPTPGALARAALGSCLAMGYRLRAARRGVPVASIEVSVETDSDIAGLIDPSCDVAAGFTQVRYAVRIVSDAPSEEIDALVDEADRLSPMLDVVARAIDVRRTSTIVERLGGGGADPCEDA
jgi:uncharacterized OsmC-like protein